MSVFSPALVHMNEPHLDVRIYDRRHYMRRLAIEYTKVPTRLLYPVLEIFTSARNIFSTVSHMTMERCSYNGHVRHRERVETSEFSLHVLEAFREFIFVVGIESWKAWFDANASDISCESEHSQVSDDDDEMVYSASDADRDGAAIVQLDTRDLRHAVVIPSRKVYHPSQQAHFHIPEMPRIVAGYPYPHVVDVEWYEIDTDRIDFLINQLKATNKKRDRSDSSASTLTQEESPDSVNKRSEIPEDEDDEASPKQPRIHDDTSGVESNRDAAKASVVLDEEGDDDEGMQTEDDVVHDILYGPLGRPREIVPSMPPAQVNQLLDEELARIDRLQTILGT